MPNITVSYGWTASRTNTATDPSGGAFNTTSPYAAASTLSMLNYGGIQFLDSSLNVLLQYGFFTSGFYIGSINGSYGASTGSFTGQVNVPWITPGMRFTITGGNNGTYEVASYNPVTGSGTLTCISSGFNTVTPSTTWVYVSGHATRSVDNDTGYVTFNNFPTITPLASGTITYVKLRDEADTFGITFDAGDIGSGADIEIDDRTVTTAQPRNISGSIRVRLPMSYTYTL